MRDAFPGFGHQISRGAWRRGGSSGATLLLAIVLSIALSGSPIGAQLPVDSAPSAPAEAAEPAAGINVAAPTATAPSGDVGSDAVVQPRSMRVYWHVFLSFGLAWLLIFGYVASLGRRFARLEREIAALDGGVGGR